MNENLCLYALMDGDQQLSVPLLIYTGKICIILR